MERNINVLVLSSGDLLPCLIDEELKIAEIDFHLVKYNSGEEFLTNFNSDFPDIIISEANREGIDLSAKMGESSGRLPYLPVIIIAEETNEEYAEELIRAGAYDYILLNNIKRIANTVLRALETRQLKKDLLYAEYDIRQHQLYTSRYKRWEANIPAMVFIFSVKPDNEGWFIYVSSAAQNLLGYLPDEIIKDPQLVINLIHPDDLKKVKRAIYRSCKTFRKIQQELRFFINDQLRWFSFIARPEIQQNGDIVFDGIMTDVTERKEAQEAFSFENNLMTVMMENSPDAIYFKDLNSRFIKVSKGYLKKFGIKSEAEVIGKTDHDIFDIQHADEAHNDELRIISDGKPVIDKLERESWGGEKVTWVSTSKVPLTDKDGKIIGTFGISRDVTERKQSEERLANEKNLMRTLIDALPHYIYIKDKEGRFLLNNKAHLNFLGAEDIKSLKGKTSFDFLDKNIAEKFAKEDLQVLTSGKSIYNKETEISEPGGEKKWLLSARVPLCNKEGKIEGVIGIDHDITSVKEIQEQLKTSEARLRSLISSTAVILFSLKLTDSGARPSWIGENIEYLLGYTPDEVLKDDWWEKGLHPDDSEYVYSVFKTLFENNNVSLELRFKHKEGHYVWLRTELTMIRSDSGKPEEIFGSWIDITERMMAQEALLNSEEQLSFALKIARIAHWEYDILKDELIFNDQFYAILRTNAKVQNGYTMTAGDFAKSFLHPEDAHIISDEIEKAVLTDNPNFSDTVEYRIVFSNGEVGYMSARFFIHKNNEGRTTRAFGVMQDITERKIYEQALRLSESQLSNALKIAHLGYWECDIERGTFTFNDQFYSLLRTNAVAEGGYIMPVERYVERFLHPEDAGIVGSEIKKAMETDDPDFSSYIEHRIKYADGKEGYFGVRFYIIKDSKGNTIKSYGANQDITERVLRQLEKQELENQLKKRNVELEKMLEDLHKMQGSLVQSEKLASLGQLSAGIAHEINNPLAFVASNMNRLSEYFADTTSLLNKWEALKAILPEDEKVNKALTEINQYTREIDLDFILSDFESLMASVQEGTTRIKRIIEGIRGFAHFSESGYSEYDINLAIDETLTILWNEIKYKASVIKMFGDIPKIKCNIMEIKQVLVNLIVNAAHAIEQKGEIRISTFTESADKPSISYVSIKIEDTGSGIPEKNLKRIFDPFFTTKPVGKGTGLGLWISSTIIEKHNGSITVESSSAAGTAFTIRLPINNEILK